MISLLRHPTTTSNTRQSIQRSLGIARSGRGTLYSLLEHYRVLPVGVLIFLLSALITPICARDQNGSSSGQLNTTTADADFKARCDRPGVVRCWDFDSEAAARPHFYPDERGKFENLRIVSDVKASGTGSLRFTIPSKSGANSSGSFWLDFTDDNSVNFGEGDEFFIQWRQRFSPEFLATGYGGDGWKTIIVGEGDRHGYTAGSCTDLEIVTLNSYYRGFPQMYHNCGGFYPMQEQIGSEFLLQNAVPCLYSSRRRPNGRPCVIWKAKQWMTFQYHVKIGKWNEPNSLVELWVADEGEPSQLVISMVNWTLRNSNPTAARYGKVWLLPYDTNKNALLAHPVAHTWYDELVISRRRIPDPVVTTPNPPTDLLAGASGHRQMRLSWVNNASNASGYILERCSDTIVNCDYHPSSFIKIATLSSKADSYYDASAIAGKTYTYRVRAFNASGKSAYSNSYSVTAE